MKTVQEGKWWSHFANFCSKSKLIDGTEEKFVSQLFELWEEEEKLFPYVLSTELAKTVEKNLIESDGHIEKTLTENDYIKLTLRKAVLWAKDNHIYNNKLGAFLTSQVCILKALRGEYYKPLFMFSAPFIQKYGTLSEEDVLKKNSIRAFHPEIYNMLKQALNTQFVE